MIIEIDYELFQKVKQIVKGRNLSIYEQLENIKPLEVATDNTLQQARELKTQKVKQSIKEAIQELLNQNVKPTKYKVHKASGVAFSTLKKYYDHILEEIKR